MNYLIFYNTQRPHTSLSYLSPLKYLLEKENFSKIWTYILERRKNKNKISRDREQIARLIEVFKKTEKFSEIADKFKRLFPKWQKRILRNLEEKELKNLLQNIQQLPSSTI